MSEQPLPPVKPEEVPDQDRAAQQEEQYLENTFRRQEKLRDVTNVVILWFLRGAASVLALVVLTVLWHYFGPTWAHWLTDQQLARVETVTSTQAFAAVVGGVGTALLGQLRKQLQSF